MGRCSWGKRIAGVGRSRRSLRRTAVWSGGGCSRAGERTGARRHELDSGVAGPERVGPGPGFYEIKKSTKVKNW